VLRAAVAGSRTEADAGAVAGCEGPRLWPAGGACGQRGIPLERPRVV